MRGIEIEVLWYDVDLVELRVTASNGRFAATTDLYAGHEAFQNLAEDGRKAAAKSSLAQIYKECEVSKMQTGAASHTALAAAVSGVNYSNEAVVTTCGGVANAVTTGGAAFSINLQTGVKTGTW